jgi:hypothetical protein
MKRPSTYIILILMIGCSPYKKVVVTGSEQLTNRWKGQTEQAVRGSLGPYKSKFDLPDGYFVLYDYSYILPPQLKKSGEFQVSASTQQSNLMAPPTPQPDHRSPDDSVIRRMYFYFDKAHLVQSVQATGFPDSVYMVKRK